MARKSSNVVAFAAWVLSFCLIIQPMPAPAQVLYGSIAGTLSDQSGAALANAHVIVTNPLTGLKREVDGNATGQYTVLNLPDGTYDIVITASGFREFKQTGVVVHAGLITRQHRTWRGGGRELTDQLLSEFPSSPIVGPGSCGRLRVHWGGSGHAGAGHCDPREWLGSIVELHAH